MLMIITKLKSIKEQLRLTRPQFGYRFCRTVWKPLSVICLLNTISIICSMSRRDKHYSGLIKCSTALGTR